MLDPVIMIEFMHLSVLKFSTLTRGGGGWRPFLHLHVKWCFDDVLIFRCVPLSKNDQKSFWNFELFSPKTYTLKGSVSELSHTAEIFWPPKCSESLNAAVRLHTSQCVSVSLHTSEYIWIRIGTRFLWCFMLFSTLKPGGWGSPDRSAGVWYRCTGSFCFNPSGPSQYMTLNSTWLLFKVRTCFWCMRTSPRIRLEAPQKRLWGASEVPQRRLRGASEAPLLRKGAQSPQPRLTKKPTFLEDAPAQKSSKSPAPHD